MCHELAGLDNVCTSNGGAWKGEFNGWISAFNSLQEAIRTNWIEGECWLLLESPINDCEWL